MVKKWKNAKGNMGGGNMGQIYGLGFIGALVYYIQQAEGFGAVITAILKACVWPAFLVHKLLGL